MKFEPSDLYSRLLMSDSDLDSLEIVPLGGPEGSDEPFEVPNELAILPIRQTVLFPGMVIPVTVVRQKAIRLVKKIYRNSDINRPYSRRPAQNRNCCTYPENDHASGRKRDHHCSGPPAF
jgi:hypothetical protein